jgi:hypothetical protein
VKRRDWLNRAGWADAEASSTFREVNGKAELVPLLIGCLRAAQDAARAAECWLQALDSVRPEELPRLVKAARSRSAWSADLLQQLAPFLDELVQDTRDQMPVREVIRGGGEAPSPGPGAALRLVPRALEPAPEKPPTEAVELPPGWSR